MPGQTPSFHNAVPHAADDWDQHWDDYGDSATGNPANSYRQHLIFRQLGPVGPDAKILDIGSGQGELALLLRSRFPSAEIWGIEYSVEGVKRAIAAVEGKKLGVRFSQRDLLSTIDAKESDRGWATHAVCSEVLEHVDRPDLLLSNARDYLAPGCRVVVTVPAGPRSAFDRHIGHRRHFTPESLRQVLDEAGFATTRIDRAGTPFFNFYRLVVMLRGRHLIDDVARSVGSVGQSRLMALVYRGFGAAFRFNLPATPFGWQLVAVATPRTT